MIERGKSGLQKKRWCKQGGEKEVPSGGAGQPERGGGGGLCLGKAP